MQHTFFQIVSNHSSQSAISMITRSLPKYKIRKHIETKIGVVGQAKMSQNGPEFMAGHLKLNI